jgi:UDP-glucose 4-epimerase
MKALVTGGAGFIGSHLVDALVARGDEVLVLDDLNTGYRENVNRAASFVEGTVADEALVRDVVRGCHVVFHQAAHKAVLRSVEQPLPTDLANTHGTLTVLKAACDEGVNRVVYASSSSVYGGAVHVPSREDEPTVPRSPYAVTKLASEHYCRVFSEVYGLETISLRYFNVYGPRQRPDATYAAVIPLFIDALAHGQQPVVFGDGLQSRDFTYIDDVVTANLAAARAPAERCSGKVYNIAEGTSHSLLDLLETLGKILDVRPSPSFSAPRAGDIRMSCADATAAARDLDFRCKVGFEHGLRRTVEWFASQPFNRSEAAPLDARASWS